MKTNITFALVDEGVARGEKNTGTVYGIGITEAEARNDARRWSGSDEGRYDVLPISAAAAAYVKKFGGEPCREVAVTRTGVLTREEVES